MKKIIILVLAAIVCIGVPTTAGAQYYQAGCNCAPQFNQGFNYRYQPVAPPMIVNSYALNDINSYQRYMYQQSFAYSQPFYGQTTGSPWGDAALGITTALLRGNNGFNGYNQYYYGY